MIFDYRFGQFEMDVKLVNALTWRTDLKSKI